MKLEVVLALIKGNKVQWASDPQSVTFDVLTAARGEMTIANTDTVTFHAPAAGRPMVVIGALGHATLWMPLDELERVRSGEWVKIPAGLLRINHEFDQPDDLPAPPLRPQEALRAAR